MTLKHIPLSLSNRGGRPLSPHWGSFVLVDPEGLERKLACDVFADIPVSDRPEPLPVLAAGAEVDVLLIPKDNLGGGLRLSSLKRRLLLADWGEREEFGFAVRFSLGEAGESRPYDFAFQASRQRARS